MAVLPAQGSGLKLMSFTTDQAVPCRKPCGGPPRTSPLRRVILGIKMSDIDLAIYVINAWINGEITDLERANMLALIQIGEAHIVLKYFKL